MSIEAHHHEALLQTARLELDRAHRGALAMDGGELRRGLELALAALDGMEGDVPPGVPGDTIEKLRTALTDLEHGSLAEMDHLVEEVRAAIA